MGTPVKFSSWIKFHCMLIARAPAPCVVNNGCILSISCNRLWRKICFSKLDDKINNLPPKMAWKLKPRHSQTVENQIEYWTNWKWHSKGDPSTHNLLYYGDVWRSYSIPTCNWARPFSLFSHQLQLYAMHNGSKHPSMEQEAKPVQEQTLSCDAEGFTAPQNQTEKKKKKPYTVASNEPSSNWVAHTNLPGALCSHTTYLLISLLSNVVRLAFQPTNYLNCLLIPT